MQHWLWIFAISVSVFSLIGSAFVIVHVLKTSRKNDARRGISRPKQDAFKVITVQGRRWNWIISIYLLLCFLFLVIILYQSANYPNRDALDCAAVPVGALFFLIQAFSTRNKAIRRERATTLTTATFAALEISATSEFGRRSYLSIFEFFENGMVHRVRYAGRPRREEGAQIELYYAPDDPNFIYVPEIEKTRSKFLPAILFFYGILFPFVALLAPLFR